MASSNGSSQTSEPSLQSASDVILPSISPNPAAIIGCGALHSVSRSANRAIGDWQFIVVLTPDMTNGAPIDVNPSTDGAVGTEMNDLPLRWLTNRVISVNVPEPTARKVQSPSGALTSTSVR